MLIKATFQKVESSLFQQVSIGSLVFLRVSFGLIMLVEVWRYFDHGWISRYYIEPNYFFHYPGFAWIKPWPGNGMYIHFYILGFASLGVMLGLFYRFSAAILFLAFSYVYFLDQTRYLNHFYLTMWIAFSMIWIAPHRAFSLDAKIRPQIKRLTVPAWMPGIIMMQMGLVYFFGGIAKINPDWLAGIPLNRWLSGKEDLPIIGILLGHDWSALFFSWSGLFIDLLAFPLLLYKKTRAFMFVILFSFHMMNVQLFNIGIFPWLATVLTTMFFVPNWPLRILNRLKVKIPEHMPEHANPLSKSRQRWISGCLVFFLLIHLSLPLRHHFFKGNVAWTEEGHRYAWRMKLRSKRGRLKFVIYDPKTSTEWVPGLRGFLQPRQIRKMAGNPEMILQFSHYLAERAKEDGSPNVEVRVLAEVSLNYRPHAFLIYPKTDLAKQTYKPFGSATWITPMPGFSDEKEKSNRPAQPDSE